MIKKISAVLMVLILVSGCDQTDLKGEIHIMAESPHVGEEIGLKLTVPEDLEEIYDVMWDVYDEEGNSMLAAGYVVEGQEVIDVFGQEWVDECYGKVGGKVDRIAVFTPSEPGTYTLEAVGFYNQTNPQPIASLEIRVD